MVGYDAQPTEIHHRNLDNGAYPDPLQEHASDAKISHNSQGADDESAQPQMPGSSHDYRTPTGRLSHTSGDETLPRTNRTLEDDEILDCSPDSIDQQYSRTAIDHSTRMSKTAHAYQTSERDKPCVQTRDRTESSEQQPALFEQYPDTPASSILEDDSCDSPSLQILSRTVDKHKEQVFFSALPTSNTNYICTCEIVKIDHFATFPPKLIEPMILAGCPAQCCPVCGAGWERVVEKEFADHHNGLANCTETKDLQTHRRGTTSCFRTGGSMQAITIGFRPTCDCNAPDSVPGVVLDPFAGSGTTAEVALHHGRQAVMIELNADYLPLQVERIERELAQPRLFTQATTAAPEPTQGVFDYETLLRR